MENIKRSYPRPCYDEYSVQLQLQEKFLSKIINQEGIKIHHLGVVQDRLKYKRVMVVLDDVDHSLQLDAIAKEARWFGPGSIIIITTQDKRVLKAHGILDIYEVDFPRGDEAFQIFCTYAFGQKYPYEGFEKLAWEVTKLCGKLPLALKVMGSHLKRMSKQEWEEELPRLRSILDGETETTMKFSYDALCNDDQALFLHIACFFNGEPLERVETFLADNFTGAKSRLRGLAEKSLISVNNWRCIKMHDLLTRLGREIVRKQSIHEPGKRQFLVDAEDICQILRNDTLGSRSVIGIDLKWGREFKISDEAFQRMSNVQFLRLQSYHGPYLLGSMNYLPPNLKFLHWDFFPKTCLPSNFNLEFVVTIVLRQSNYLEKLWEGNKTIRNLKWMHLIHIQNLKELPDLSTATNLQKLCVRECWNLVEIPSSIGNAVDLESLDLTSCSNLVRIPSSIWNLVNLQSLDLSYCSSLVKLPSPSGNAIIKLEELNLRGCTSLRELPSSMENATNLKKLNLKGCLHLLKLSSSISNLRELYLKGCSSLRELPSCIGNMTNIKELDLTGCSSLVELPFSIGNLGNLIRLRLKGCSKLKSLPININMASLDELDLTDCSSLKSFPEISTNIGSSLLLNGTAIEEIPPSIRSWPRLYNISMSYCENLRKSQHAFHLIMKLHLSDTRIQEIAPWVKDMSRLHVLVIKGCTKLVSLPRLPDSLRYINVESCEALERLDWSLYKTRFAELSFVNCFKLNPEARDLIIKAPRIGLMAVNPGEAVPTYFTYRATGSSLSMKLYGSDTHLIFRACVLLVNKGDIEDAYWYAPVISYHIENKLSRVIYNSGYSCFTAELSPPLKHHMFVFEFKTAVRSEESVFKFEFKDKNWGIEECGLRPLETLDPSC